MKKLSIATIFVFISMIVISTPISAQSISPNGHIEKGVKRLGNKIETVSENKELPSEAATIVYSGKDGDLDWTLDSAGLLTISGTGDFEIREEYETELDDGPEWECNTGWIEHKESIKNVIVNVSGITSTSDMFLYCRNIVSIDMSGLDTSQVTDMDCMFRGCSNLTSLDVSNFDTSQVTDMSGMFYDCNSLANIDVSGFDTSQVTDMDCMFRGCSNLTSLDVSSFDTSRVTDMDAMFSDCSSLTSLDVSGFDTSRATSMRWIFSGCNSLGSLNVSSLDTSQVTDMYNMFSGCNSLTSLDVSGFNTSQVMDMEAMFSDCSSLTSLDLSSFDTSQVTNMWGMFLGCSGLTSLNVSSFDTSQVINTDYMFKECGNLVNLDLSSFYLNKECWNTYGMFQLCNNLTELKAPKNVNDDIDLPSQAGYVWKDSEGNVCTTITKGISTSIVYMRYIDITGATIISIGNQPYTGNSITPEPMVISQEKILEKGTDYILTYANNINPGQATITIIGIGQYTGSKTIIFIINQPINIVEATISVVGSETYTGKEITPQPKVVYGNTVLQKGIDYTLTYENNINSGTATIAITGKGKYTGSRTITFTIDKVNLDKAKISSLKFSHKKGNFSKLNTKTYYSLYLDFVPVDFAKKYEIELTNNKGKKVETVTVDCENKDYVEKNIKNLTAEVYGVRIRAICDGVYGEWSDKSYVLKQPRAQARTTKGNVQIKWEKFSGATGYDIYMSTKQNSGYKKVASVGKNTTIKTIKKYNKKTLKTKTYYYYVVAKKKVGSKTYKSGKSYVYKVKNREVHYVE